MDHSRPYSISPAFAFVSYPNKNSAFFREFYNIPGAHTVHRGNLRYQGFPKLVKALVKIGFVSAEAKEWLKEGLTWAEITQKAIGAENAQERFVSAR